MEATAGDMLLFFKKVHAKLSRLIGTYVDDSLLACDETFLELSKKTQKRFESKDREKDNTRFAGVYIETLKNDFKLQQLSYLNRLNPLPEEFEFAKFRSARYQLAWTVHSRPDVCIAANFLTQITEKLFDKKHIQLFNNTFYYLKDTKEQVLFMQKQDCNTLLLKVFYDATFANNADVSSQLGYIIPLCEGQDRCNIIIKCNNLGSPAGAVHVSRSHHY